jgi:ribose transport system permease protein
MRQPALSRLSISDSARYNLRSTIPIWVLVVVLTIVVVATSTPFRSGINVSNVLTEMAPLIVVSAGQALVILLGGIDLSVGSVMSLSTVLVASYATFGGNGIANLVLVLAMGLCVGLVNGFGTILGINPLIMTLSTLAAVKGIALLILASPGGTLSPEISSLVDLGVGNVPFFFLLALVLALLVWYVSSATTWGRRIYAVGSSTANAAKSGIDWRKTTVLTYAGSGLLAAIAGLALVGRVYSGDPLSGDPYALDSITAVVLGGIALTGGRGSILGAVAGAMLLALVDNVLTIYGVSAYYQFVAKGLILIGALLVYNVGGFNPGKLVRVPPRLWGRKRAQ